MKYIGFKHQRESKQNSDKRYYQYCICFLQNIGNSCSVVFHTLLIGLLVSTAVTYMLNLQFFFSVSRMHLELKKIASIVSNIKFVELMSSRDGGMERSVANASNITRGNKNCPWPPKYLSKYN